jgi:hypothetical protein
MRRYNPNMGVTLRQQIIDSARDAGRWGSPNLPPIVHSVDSSDSMIVEALDAHALGVAEREKERTP